MDEGPVLLAVGGILAASIAVALAAERTGLPVLVAFLGLGMLLGSDGPGGIEFDDAELPAARASSDSGSSSTRAVCRRRGVGSARSPGRPRS